LMLAIPVLAFFLLFRPPQVSPEFSQDARKKYLLMSTTGSGLIAVVGLAALPSFGAGKIIIGAIVLTALMFVVKYVSNVVKAPTYFEKVV